MNTPPKSLPASGALRRRSADRARPLASALALPEQHLGAIRQSHERCAALGLSRVLQPDHAPLGRADLGLVRERHQRLHAHAAPVMEMLFGQIEGTQSMVVLCDSAGTIIHSIGDDDFLSRAAKVALQPGVNWSEPTKGTNAVGTALIEERPTLVHADEHYLHANHFLTCSAAPIFDPRGNVLGVLDVSGDHRSYHAHTMALVTLSARMIENQWLCDDHRHALRLHFHRRPEFIGTLMEGILAVAPDGRVLGANRGAQEQLGLSGVALRMQSLQSLLGTTVGAVMDPIRSPMAQTWVAHSQRGQAFHVQTHFNAASFKRGQARGWDAGSGARPVAVPVGAVAAAAQGAPSATARVVRTPAGLSALDTGDAQVAGVLQQLRRVQDQGVPVILVGETGTGKDVLARALHHDSQRTQAVFVAVPCAAVGASELEDAVQRAEGGTLYLDGVDELPPALQAHLLHLLDEPAFALISATHRPLQTASTALRQDLYHRLQGLTVTLPPLRLRSDLAALARLMLQADDASRSLQLAASTLAELASRPWPGNLRQLQRVLRTSALLAGPDGTLMPEHLPVELRAEQAAEPLSAVGLQPESLLQTERRVMEQALQACGGNVSQAARRLGVSRNTLYRRLRPVVAAAD